MDARKGINMKHEIIELILIRISLIAIFLLFGLLIVLDKSEAKEKCFKQFKQNIEDIRLIYKHPDSQFIRLDNEEKKQIKKQLIEKPSLRIYLD
jgi:hypothetical protein